MTEYQVIEADETVYRDGTIKLHGEAGFEGMRKAGRLAVEILDELTGFVQPGVTTGEIDDKARTMMLDAGAVPATMGYRGYTHSCCTSINHVICHESRLQGAEGRRHRQYRRDPAARRWHGDTSRMFFAGEPSLKAQRLVDVTHERFMLGIEAAAKPGARLGDIGAAIEAHARQFAMSSGILRSRPRTTFHDAPEVIHAARRNGPELKPGMFFTIEPMIMPGGRTPKSCATAGLQSPATSRYAQFYLDRHHR